MKAAGAFVGLPRGLERSLSSNIPHALIELLGARIEAVLSAGKDIPVGVCIRCLLDACIRNAKQYLGLAVIGAARQKKQCQADNGNVSFLASPKSCQNKVSRVSYAHATTCSQYRTKEKGLPRLRVTARSPQQLFNSLGSSAFPAHSDRAPLPGCPHRLAYHSGWKETSAQ
jgi:hypothetical protein